MIKIKDMVAWNNSKIVHFNVECFERQLIIVFRDFDEFSFSDVKGRLYDNYCDWLEDDYYDYCCEEYMIGKLPDYYKNNIMCVLYEYDKNNEDDEYDE